MQQYTKTPGTRQEVPTRLQYPIKEGALLLGVSAAVLIRDIRRGKVRTNRYGTRVLIPAAEIARIAAEGMAA